jgi:hypothetical protein
MPHLTIVRWLATSGFALCAASVPPGVCAQSTWLPPLPARTEIEHLPGGVSVNGVQLEVALAMIPLSLEHARGRIARAWGARDADVRSMSFRDGWLLARRVGSNHDTVTLQAQHSTLTRAVFSRANLALPVALASCRFAVPQYWVLVSATRSTRAGSSTDQCVYRHAATDREAFARLDAAWRRDGWRLAAPAASAQPVTQQLARWTREGNRRTAILEPGGVAGLVLIMAGASAP